MKARVRIVKEKRLWKPYRIQLSLNHKTYSSYDKKFWTPKQALRFVNDFFNIEVELTQKIVEI